MIKPPQRRRGALLQSGFLIVTLVLALWLGYQAVDAAASHERTVDASLADYAGISAWEFAAAVRSTLNDVLDDAFRPVRRRMRGGMPSAEVVGWELRDAARDAGCRCRGFDSPLAVFKVSTNPSISVEAVPDTLSLSTRTALAELTLAQRDSSGPIDDGLFTLPEDGPFAGGAVVGFMTSQDATGATDAAYGFVVRPGDVAELLARVHRDRRLLPEPLASNLPNDSLLFVRVRDASGLVLFSSPPEVSPDGWAATEPIDNDFGSLAVDATVRPQAASLLIIGGVPTSRLPLLAMLLVLTLGVGAAAIVQSRRELRFQQLRDDFVSGVSHELRTPLAQIQMFAELHEAGKLTSDEDRTRAISVIHRETKRLGHLVENILQFTRLRRTDVPLLPRQRVDAAASFAEGIASVAPLLEVRGMKVAVSAEPDIAIDANRDALTRIVINLLDNAAKYGPAGQTVRVGIARHNDTVRLTVEDEGPGIPADQIERIWNPYLRLERPVDAAQPGTGLGLAVVSQLAHHLGGRAWAENRAPERGARFTVELPIAPGGHAEGVA